MPVRRAQVEISSSEFVEWLAYRQIEPFGDEREDIRNAALRMAIAVACGNKNLKLADFIIKFDHEPIIQSAAHLEAQFAAVYGPKNKSKT